MFDAVPKETGRFSTNRTTGLLKRSFAGTLYRRKIREKNFRRREHCQRITPQLCKERQSGHDFGQPARRIVALVAPPGRSGQYRNVLRKRCQ